MSSVQHRRPEAMSSQNLPSMQEARQLRTSGMDANQIVAHGIPTVTLGVGQGHAHTPEETLDLQRFWTACRIATALIE